MPMMTVNKLNELSLMLQKNSSKISESKIINLLTSAMSSCDSSKRFLSLLANLKPFIHESQTLFERCHIISSIINNLNNISSKNLSDNDSCVSSSNQSYNTVICSKKDKQQPPQEQINDEQKQEHLKNVHKKSSNNRCCNLNRKCAHNRHHNDNHTKRNRTQSNSRKNNSRESLRISKQSVKRNSAIIDDELDHQQHKQLIKRIRQRKHSLMSNDSTWSEELWVDGPKVQTIDQCCLHSLSKKKKHRIEQWISINSYRNHNNESFTSSILDSKQMLNMQFQFMDDNYFNDRYHQRNHDDESRDTLSDCGDKKSDFYDEYYHLWKPASNVQNNRHSSFRKHQSKFTNPISNINRNINEQAQPPSSASTALNQKLAEPPKQLKLEQFLQQLSKITISSTSSKDFKLNSSLDNQCQQQQQSFGMNDIIEQHLKEINHNTDHQNRLNHQQISLSSPTSSILDEKHTIHSSLHQKQQQKRLQQQQETKQTMVETKMKRNTTSTTTSGHGTISEGECSSIIKKTSSVSTPSYGSNGVVGDCADDMIVVDVTDSNNVIAKQLQPAASSGYESTIQDDDDNDHIDQYLMNGNNNKLYNHNQLTHHNHHNHHHHHHHHSQSIDLNRKLNKKQQQKQQHKQTIQTMTMLTNSNDQCKTIKTITIHDNNDDDDDDRMENDYQSSTFCSFFCCNH